LTLGHSLAGELMLTLLNKNKYIIRLNEHSEYLISLTNAQISLEGKFSLHVVSTVLSIANIALSIQDESFALSAIV